MNKEFTKKMVDLYNFLIDRNMSGGEVYFSNGIIFKCKIDINILEDIKPVIDLTKAEVRKYE